MGVIPTLSILSGKEHHALSRECAGAHRPRLLGPWKQAALRHGGGMGGGADWLLFLERLLWRLVWKLGLKNKVARPPATRVGV